MRITAHFNEDDKARLLRSLSDLAKDDNLTAPFRKVAQTVKVEVEGRIPKDTRELVSSWKYEQKSDKEATFGFTAEYAAYQHEGGDGKDKVIIKRPAGGESYFLTNAINAKKSDIEVIIGKFIQQKIFKAK
ncbi:MAG: HK97 gp10 family phage protein [Fusobacteriaceae bacterium]